MPLLLLMFLVAFVAVFRPRARRALARLRMPMLVSILVTGGVMGYGYYANRYASEFVPAFVLGGAITTALLCGFLARHRAWRVPVLAVIVARARRSRSSPRWPSAPPPRPTSTAATCSSATCSGSTT